MTLDNNEVVRLNAKVLEVPVVGLHAVINLLASNDTNDGADWPNARYGRLSIKILENDNKKQLLMTVELLNSSTIGTICRELSVSESKKIDTGLYVASGLFRNIDMLVTQESVKLVVSDTAISLTSEYSNVDFFQTNNENRVYRFDPMISGSVAVRADFNNDHFRNLLNKLGKESGIVHLFSKENTFAGVLGEEAQCLASYYKADNVSVTHEVETAILYSEVYDLLYRRKAGNAGLYNRVSPEGDDIRIRVLQNGDLVLIFVIDRSVVTLTVPNNLHKINTNVNVNTLTIAKKTTRKSSKSVQSTMIEAVIEEPVVEVNDTESVAEVGFTEQEHAIMEQWRLIHLAAGGTSDSEAAWFRDYCMHQIRSGLEISQEHLDIASRL